VLEELSPYAVVASPKILVNTGQLGWLCYVILLYHVIPQLL